MNRWKTAAVAGIAIGAVDIAGFARSLGAHGISVEHEDQLASAFGEAVRRGGVSVIDIQVDPELTTPTKRLSALVELAVVPAIRQR